MSRLLAITAWLALPACTDGLGLDELASENGGVFIEELVPFWGPTAGGTEVTITGSGFEGALSVSFGNASLDVTKVAENTVVVVSPALGFEDSVDVSLGSDLGTYVLEGGFTYSDSGPPDPVDTGADDTGDTDDVEPTGLTGGLVDFSLTQIACPICLGLTSYVSVEASVGFHTPTSGSWIGWLPATGQCVQNPSSSALSSSMTDVGEYVYLNSGSRSVSLRRTTGTSGQLVYQGSGLGEEDFIRTAYYDVSVPDGGSLGSFNVSDGVLTPQGWDNIGPIELLYDYPLAFTAAIRRSNATFSWSPSGGTGTFIVLIEAYNSSSGMLLGSLLCRGQDNGSMTVPSSAFTGFPTGSLLTVGLYRYQVETGTIPANGSSLEGIARMGVIGTGVLRQ